MHPRRYETLMMTAPNLAPEDLAAFKNKVDGIIAQGEGQVVRFEDWGRRRLAYPIQKEMYGHYFLYDFQGSPALASELERNLKIDEKVFKYLTLVLDKTFTDERLAEAKERLVTEAAKREAEKAKALEEAQARAKGEEGDGDDDARGEALGDGEE